MLKRFVTAFIFLTISLNANSANNSYSQELETLLSSYFQAVESHQETTAIGYANQAFELANQLNLSDEELAPILLIYAPAAEDSAEVISLLTNMIDQIIESKGKNDKSLVEFYLVLGEIYFNNDTFPKGRSLLRKIPKIAKRYLSEDPFFEGRSNSRAGRALMSFGMGNRAIPHLKNAIKQLTPSNSLQDQRALAQAHVWAGRYHMRDRKYPRAVNSFQQAINILEVIDPDSPDFEAGFFNMVTVLEIMEQSDQADYYVQFIAKNFPPENDNRLFMVSPTFPRQALYGDHSGSITVKFDIDALGRVNNISVIEPDSLREFNISVVEALSQWRYSPLYINGSFESIKDNNFTYTYSKE